MHLFATRTQLFEWHQLLVHQFLQSHTDCPWWLLDDLRRFELNRCFTQKSTIEKRFSLSILASHPTAEVHLHCGTRERIGVPSWSTSSPNLGSSPPISSPFDHGWSRLAFNDPTNPTTPLHDQMMRMRLTTPTPRSTMPTTSSKYQQRF